MLYRESPANNITVVVPRASDLEQFAPLQSYYDAGCAVIEGVYVTQHDAQDKVLLLSDERIVCYDEAIFA
jgi:hypothetical protein